MMTEMYKLDNISIDFSCIFEGVLGGRGGVYRGTTYDGIENDTRFFPRFLIYLFGHQTLNLLCLLFLDDAQLLGLIFLF